MAKVRHPKDLIHHKGIRDPRGVGDLPAIQAEAIINYDSFITMFCLPTPPTTCMSNGTIVNFDIDPNGFQMAEHLVIKLNITCSSAAVIMAPSPFWFRTIKLRNNKGAGEYLKWWYPEEMVVYLSLLEKNVRDFYEKNGMLRFIELKEELALCYAPSLNVGESRDIYIPLSASFLDMNSLHGQHIAQTMRFELEFNSDFAVSGTTTNITVNSISLLVRQHELPESEQKEWLQELKGKHRYYQYLDVMQVTDNTKTLTASTLTRFALDPLVGKVPFLLVCIKPSLNPVSTDQSRFRPVPVGENATWDIQSPSQEPLLGKGNAMNNTYLRGQYIRLTGKKPVRGYYLFPFTDDIMSSFQGVVSGYRSFNGSKDTLALTFGSAGTAEVHTWASTGTINAGVWHFTWKGEYLAQSAYNAPDTTVEANLLASDRFKALGYSVDLPNSSTAMAQASNTVTFHIRNGSPSLDNDNNPIYPIGQALNPGEITPTITTRGITGFTTSATYQTEIFVFHFRRVKIDKEGVWSTFTL